MRFILGMIFGCLLLVLGVYFHDAQRAGTTPDGQPVASADVIVNWNVAQREFDHGWNVVKDRAREGWTRLAQQF
jgi:hypothetical protein